MGFETQNRQEILPVSDLRKVLLASAEWIRYKIFRQSREIDRMRPRFSPMMTTSGDLRKSQSMWLWRYKPMHTLHT